ncbi:PseudoU-synth-1 domain-containing protein [Aphelenchoides besseyi]|nr:PseudoU-synth-1 domain-containing protein [Aphelenchoides besseyi]
MTAKINGIDQCEPTKQSESKKKREFDFSRFPERRVAFLFLYVGWEFDGYVAQPGQSKSTEDALLEALERTKLIRSRDYAEWNRCGRTDKNVSGFRQVATCVVRSTHATDVEVEWPSDSTEVVNRVDKKEELNYTKILNAVLPKSVRILAWAPVSREFSARFQCTQRAYRYVRRTPIYNHLSCVLQLMRDAAKRLVGSHDFRNFCQIDNSKCRLNTTYVREIFSVQIEEIDRDPSAYSMCSLIVRGSGFLWHQIRFICALLFDVGNRKEAPQLISDLLDTKKFPSRPTYLMAKDLPLCFFDCSFDVDLKWKFDVDCIRHVIHSLQSQWAEVRIKSEILKKMIDELGDTGTEGLDQYTQSKNHVPIAKRPATMSIEERVAKRNKF